MYHCTPYPGVSNSWSTRTVSVTYSEVLPTYHGTRILDVHGVPQIFRVCPCSVGSGVPRLPPVTREVYRTKVVLALYGKEKNDSSTNPPSNYVVDSGRFPIALLGYLGRRTSANRQCAVLCSLMSVRVYVG